MKSGAMLLDWQNGTRPRRTVVSTNMNTPNLGNEALSTELIRLARKLHQGDLFSFPGRPSGLDAYSVARLNRSGYGAMEVFDDWAERIVKTYRSRAGKRSWAQGEFETPSPRVTMQRSPGFLPQESVGKRALRKAYRAWTWHKAYPPIYERRLNLLDQADLLVYAGAGEVGDTSFMLRQLLEILVAMKLGCSVVAVNQSVQVASPLYRLLLGNIYSRMDEIIVRGSLSRQTLLEIGVPGE